MGVCWERWVDLFRNRKDRKCPGDWSSVCYSDLVDMSVHFAMSRHSLVGSMRNPRDIIGCAVTIVDIHIQCSTLPGSYWGGRRIPRYRGRSKSSFLVLKTVKVHPNHI